MQQPASTPVTLEQLFAIIGAKEVEATLLREQVARQTMIAQEAEKKVGSLVNELAQTQTALANATALSREEAGQPVPQ